MGKKTNFGDYIRQVRNDRRLSLRAVEKLSDGKIKHGHLSRIENKDYANLTISTIKILADAYNLPAFEVALVACGIDSNQPLPVKPEDILGINDGYRRLNSGRRSIVDAIINALLVEQTLGIKAEDSLKNIAPSSHGIFVSVQPGSDQRDITSKRTTKVRIPRHKAITSDQVMNRIVEIRGKEKKVRGKG